LIYSDPPTAGRGAFANFQKEMSVLLEEMDRRGEPQEGDYDIGSQLWRVRKEAGVDDGRLLSEIGILFVEGFETTGHTISWTLFNIATVPGARLGGAHRSCRDIELAQ
jgi:cytochrome P450